MDRLWYEMGGEITDLLKKSGLDWRATGDFALDVILGKKPIKYIAYIRPGQEALWDAHLKSHGARPTDFFPRVVLISAKDFDLLSNGHYNGIPVVKPEQIMKDANPRYVENIRSIMDKIPYLSKSA
jgi:hypothetical protein